MATLNVETRASFHMRPRLAAARRSTVKRPLRESDHGEGGRTGHVLSCSEEADIVWGRDGTLANRMRGGKVKAPLVNAIVQQRGLLLPMVPRAGLEPA